MSVESSWYKAMAPIVGTAIKKLNFEAVLLSSPKNRPAEMVMPDLEVPGIKAMAWDKPIIKESLKVISSTRVFFGFVNVDKYNTSPNKIVVMAIMKLVLRWESIKSMKMNPINRVGIQEIINCFKSKFRERDLNLTTEYMISMRSALKYIHTAISVPRWSDTS